MMRVDIATGIARRPRLPAGNAVAKSSTVALAVALALGACAGHAQGPLRLSDWMVSQPSTTDGYPLGLTLKSVEETGAQAGLKLRVLRHLAEFEQEHGEVAGAATRLKELVASMPVTGRIPVTVPDVRWLQANPMHDPVLRPGFEVVLPRRPKTVTVVTATGERCSVPHVPGREAKHYVAACQPDVGTDWAWLAQPDGRMQRFGIALWNLDDQDEPAPGAWIWAPGRRTGWPDAFSERLLAFLATQGPAQDPDVERPCTTSNGGVSSGGAAEGLRRFQGMDPVTSCPRVMLPANAGDDVDYGFLASGRSRGLDISASDWGTVGLLQTPTARMNPAGTFWFHYGRVLPYTNGNIFVQPFDWLEVGFRYTDISNRLYGTINSISGSQTYKDKSVDFKLRLLNESAYLPQVALGLRDIGGTGLFGGEFLVANKRTGDFDWSLGLGWGYLGARGDLRNPLSMLSNRFDSRAATAGVGTGGNFSFSSYFRGNAALFGGLQYQTPWKGLVLKAEYEGNNYTNEPFSNAIASHSPFNFGLVYRFNDWGSVSLGVERGNAVMLAFTIQNRLDRLYVPKYLDAPRIPVAETRPDVVPDWARTSADISRQTNWDVRRIERDGGDVRVTVGDSQNVYWRERLDRAVTVLHRDAPREVDRFTFTYRDAGLDVAEHVVDRSAWVEERTKAVNPGNAPDSVIARSPEPPQASEQVYAKDPKKFEHGLGFNVYHSFGGPEAFMLYQAALTETLKFRFTDDTWLQGVLRLSVADNYDRFKSKGPLGSLPPVRTLKGEYVRTSRFTMSNMQVQHVGQLSDNQYFSVYGGYLEDMYGGFGGEWLYRPFAGRLAIGVDMNAVRQREFRQDFSFRDYSTVTGHATAYWDTGWNDVLVKTSFGQYLARDIGATFEISRQFRNGIIMGGWATKTNISAAEFGEGSFDKGVYIGIPFDAMFMRTTGSMGFFSWRPITRDGGAMLDRQAPLYAVTRARNERALSTVPASEPNDRLLPHERVEPYEFRKTVSAVETRVVPKVSALVWESKSTHPDTLRQALYRQGFRNIKVSYDGSHRLSVEAMHEDMRPLSRAAGRATRAALRLAPIDAREIHVTIAERGDPSVRYEFFDIPRLEKYFGGTVSAIVLSEHARVDYPNPAVRQDDAFLGFDDLEPVEEPKLPPVTRLVPETLTPTRVKDDLAGAFDSAAKIDWLKATAYGAGLFAASTLFDRRAAKNALTHANDSWMTNGIRVGDAIPWLGMAGAAAAALNASDPRMSKTGYAAGEAGATAFLAATGLKYVVGRARPTSGFSPGTFERGSSDDRYASFPSRHTSVAWAVATPFALEYDMPILYGVAGLTNLARIGSREHWVSDTVASSLIGYGIGRLFWESSRNPKKGEARVMLQPNGVGVRWETQ